MEKRNIKILKSTFWFSVSSIISFLVSFFQAFFLAKFFSRGDYGLYSLVFLIVSMFDSFSEFGVKDAMIRQNETNDLKLYTAFWIEFLRNIICFIFLISSAQLFSNFYGNSKLYYLIIIISFKFIFNSFKNINMFKLYRDEAV